MASEDSFPVSPLARTYPEDSRQHAAALMNEFDAVMLMMNHISQGVTEGICRTMEDLGGETSRELDVDCTAKNLTRELANSLSVGVPRRIFDALYQSFSELNFKLASRIEVNITPERHVSNDPLNLKSTSRPSTPISASAQSLCHHGLCEDSHDVLEPSEGQSVSTTDRCCVCSTPASAEELMTTPCCSRDVGSICWEERLQETDKCCLCQTHQPRYSAAPSDDDAPDYKIHFNTESHQDGTDVKAEVEIDRADSLERGQNFSTGNAVAGDPLSHLDLSKALIANFTVNKETEVLSQSGLLADIEATRTADDRRKHSKYDKAVSLDYLNKFSKDFKLPTPVPKDTGLFSSQSTARPQNCEPAKNAQLMAPDPPAQTTTIVSVPCTRSQVSVDSEDRGDHLVTKSHILKLIDPDVIYHLKGIHEEDLLDLVHSALKERVHRTTCTRFFRQAQVLNNGDIGLWICSKCSQDSDLMKDMKYWPRGFESFLLTTQLRSYKVIMDPIQVRTMNIVGGAEKFTTIRRLVNDNASVLKFLKNPADIREICWNTKIIGLNPNKYLPITITFSTARQANDAIEHGILWNHERRVCRRPGAHPRITQCGRCQAYGHIFKECSSAPRCKVCAEMHLSTACTHNHAANKACLKCAWCGGPHDATSEKCKSRKVEKERVKLANRFYRTGAEKAEQIGTASAA